MLKVGPGDLIRLDLPGGGSVAPTRAMLPGDGGLGVRVFGRLVGTVAASATRRNRWLFDFPADVAIRRFRAGGDARDRPGHGRQSA